MFSGAPTGEMPWWYVWVRAARAAGIPPWVLFDQAVEGIRPRRRPGASRYPYLRVWMERLLIAEQAETKAQAIVDRKAAAESRRKQETAKRRQASAPTSTPRPVRSG